MSFTGGHLVTDTAEEAEISLQSACAMYKRLRDVCSAKLFQQPIRLGGPGKTVQIDVSCGTQAEGTTITVYPH